MSDTDASAGGRPTDHSALAEISIGKTQPSETVFAVLNVNRAPLRAGQVVFGTSAQVSALGADARLATPAEISVSSPSHFPLES